MIRRWLGRLAVSFSNFMRGRYGTDRLSLFMLICSLFFTALSNFKHLKFAYFIGLALIILACARSLSRNFAKRQRELDGYNRLMEKPRAFIHLCKNKWRDRKTHKYFKCKQCKTVLRVPKNRGKIEVTCPQCHSTCIKKS